MNKHHSVYSLYAFASASPSFVILAARSSISEMTSLSGFDLSARTNVVRSYHPLPKIHLPGILARSMTNAHTQKHTHISTYAYTHSHTRIHLHCQSVKHSTHRDRTDARTNTHTHIHIHTSTYAHTYTLTHTFAHIRTSSPVPISQAFICSCPYHFPTSRV